MRTIDNGLEDVFLAGWSLALGTALIIAPWWLGFDGQTSATWNAWACGCAVVILSILSILAMAQAYDWLEYASAAVGMWLCAAPWALGFADGSPAAWAHVGLGAAVVVSAGAELWRLREAPGARTV